MSKNVMIVGIFGILAIVSIVMVVNSTNTGFAVYDDDFFVRPSGMKFNTQSGVSVLQTVSPIISTCSSTVFCEGEASYVCCKHDASSCILPGAIEEAKGACPETHRGRCQCREDYIAGLFEKYGEIQ